MERVRRVRAAPVEQEAPPPAKSRKEEILARLAAQAARDRDDPVQEDPSEDVPHEGETLKETGDRIEAKYRARADSPLRAIRAFCVLCVGCQPKAVSGCTATNCVLYPFRMGSNPYQKHTKK